MKWKVDISLPELALENHKRVCLSTPLTYTVSAKMVKEGGEDHLRHWKFSAVVECANEVSAVKYALAICGGLLLAMAEKGLVEMMLENDSEGFTVTESYHDIRKVDPDVKRETREEGQEEAEGNGLPTKA